MVDRRAHHLRCTARGSGLPVGGAYRPPAAAARRSPRPLARAPAEHALHELAVLSRAQLDTSDEDEILRLAMDHVAAAGPYRAEAAYLEVDGELLPSPTAGPVLPAGMGGRVRRLAGRDGPVSVPGRPWGRALGLRGTERLHGYLVVTSRSRPTATERSRLATLARHTATALSTAFARRRERETALELHRLRGERGALQHQLISVVAELGHQRALHALMAEVAASGGGEESVTRALHDLTGLPALVEDRFGRLRAWSGPGRPDPYPEPDPVQWDEMLHTVARQAGAVRMKDRLVTLARPHGEILGVLTLVDARGEADDHTLLALEHATTPLALELAHLRNLAEVELRLHRELVDDLLAGTDEASAYARSEAVGHDLHRSHYVVVVQWSNRAADEPFAQSVGRAASTVGMRSLLTRRSGQVVMITDHRPHAHALYEALAQETGTLSGSIGVSSACDSPNGIPHRYEEAQRALGVRRDARERHGTTFFDELGLYRILGPGNDRQQLEMFVDEWLGPLADYDARHHTAMVETLSRYFDCGGNYDETAKFLRIHRSTLRYRLKRIREISGKDLADTDDRLTLQVAARLWRIAPGAPG
ncbi:PucR family transcriptional regulator [Streptomyces sp. NPDC017991]|uniref:PucR family transcriptional regulator n=1 Tax=Streptomyces sp. NPDC017991 TaxID=3365026 RepID=UPI0037AC9657